MKTVFVSVSDEFGIESPLPDPSVYENYIFPTPEARYRVFCEMSDASHELLWRLYNDTAKDEPTIDPIDFENALKLSGVGVTRLTQTLFLINPGYFQPVDNITDGLSGALGLPAPSAIETELKKEGGYEKYRALLKRLKEAFPGCQPYELNMLFYFLKTKSKYRIEMTDQFYQVSTHAFGDDKPDYWEGRVDSFKENNWVYVGGQRDRHPYPLESPTRGDVILVRTGKKIGRAIGIVFKNDYRDHGKWNKELRIHVLWINKQTHQLKGQTTQDGFWNTRPNLKTYKAFQNTKIFRPSLNLIGKLTGQHRGEQNVENLHPLNQILYGPPGTSKTWHTVNHALAIIDNKPVDRLELETKEDREDKMQRFDELKKNGQIEMVTFHQNYNYEDFVEGIRPVLDDVSRESVRYELVPGVFRRIANRADENRRQSKRDSGESWDIDGLLDAYAESILEKRESGIHVNLFADDRSRATIEDVNWTGNTFKSVRLGGMKTQRRLTRSVIKRDYEAFYKGDIESIKDIRPTYRSKRSYHGNARYYFELYKQIKDFHDNEWKTEAPVSVAKQNYVLIIDEINRGNIAKIFGELITLIEDSKRIGRGDATTVRLPNSKDEDEDEEFGVPDNLFIIGTMNTADRSIALLDTALRRRFEFVEMMPVSNLVPEDIDGVRLRELIESMNKRIRFLLDREHQIGHTYFMNIHNLTTLKAAFKNKIIPLLQEYFYDNWEKIDFVLNGNGFIEDRTEKLHEEISESLPEDNKRELGRLIDAERKIYELLPDASDSKWNKPESYKAIYEKVPAQAGNTE